MGRRNKPTQTLTTRKKQPQRNQQQQQDTLLSTNSNNGSNRPKNYLITDATLPFEFVFYRFGSPVTVQVEQTPAEDLWPGGALWDLGVLLAKVLVLLTRGASLSSPNNVAKTSSVSAHVSSTVCGRLHESIPFILWKDVTVLELGCGVGLTGLVAAALGARSVVLTDLEHVISGITQHNVELNNNKTGGAVTAMPLCWGNSQDEQAVAGMLDSMSSSKSNKKGRIKKACHQEETTQRSFPDIILIGDVAYQHKPGAPSHFDALLSTLLKFVSHETLVVFGTRMRMPASADLLDMFHEHLVEQVNSPLEAHEIDSSFGNLEGNKKHNMTIHFLHKRKL